jgi:ribosomal protein S18 acetylase RimI-like enzyme
MTAQIQVRQARGDDEAALAGLDAAAWSPQSGFPSVIEPATDAEPAFFSPENPPEIHLVAELDSTVVGYIRLKPPTHLPENAHVLQVSGLAVHPAARRRGIAAALLTASDQHARDRGARKLTLRVLSTNQPAVSLYDRLGYEREGVLRGEFIVNGADVDDVLMAKHL